ncbi:hypothetical protein [Arenicella xantha]|nr:hypothetical protein [Arenicella xantha]
MQQKYPLALPLSALLLTYFLLRLFFQQYVAAKSWFIFPSGMVVNWFNGTGIYIHSEWVFNVDGTRFVLGAPCSGTTFFSLLSAYVVYRLLTHKISVSWLLLVYPIAIAVNSMRVLSSIPAHNALVHLNLTSLSTNVHVITGTVTFATCFLLLAYLIEKTNAGAMQ